MVTLARDIPPLPGMTFTTRGAEFAVFATNAREVTLALYPQADDGTPDRVALSGPLHGWWYAELPGLPPGTPYHLYADGPWQPEIGHRYDPGVALLDPYAKAVDAHGRAVAITGDFDWGHDAPPARSWSESVIYEAHVRGLTMRHPGLPAQLRGTYAGLAHPVLIDHLVHVGVTALELLPVHLSTTEPGIAERGLSNYWGYNSLGFFAPDPRYAAATDPAGVVAEFKGMVKALHEAGIEVILDVVYNHTAEQEMHRPALSWRGLDNSAYYRMDANGREIDTTGCGNTIDTNHPIAQRMVLDSLRYWVTQMHVDGFRFDLAPALARGPHHDYTTWHPFHIALMNDPVLSRVKLIAEPWDVGPDGWQTGAFPPPFAEWNDRFRDDVRTFWLTDTRHLLDSRHAHGARHLATRLSGSADLFHQYGRTPTSSVNFVAAHDGFTTADVVSYDHKHNEANGEDNRDGASHNLSWNHGTEGPSQDPATLEWRRRSIRNLLGTLLLSTGVPMLNAGDEFGRSQGGNNNAYCQDNETGWVDWDHEPWQRELTEHVAALTRLRREHPALRQTRFFNGRPRAGEGRADLAWYTADGREMEEGHWHDPGLRTFTMHLASAAGRPDVLVVVHGGVEAGEVTLPHGEHAAPADLLWSSARERHDEAQLTLAPGQRYAVAPCSLHVFAQNH